MKLFPIMDASSYRFRDELASYVAGELMSAVIAIPWNMIAPHEQQALKNHSQTLERLAQRGGLSSAEAVAVLEGTDVFKMRMNGITSQKRLAHLLAEWMTARRLAGSAEWRCFHCNEAFTDPKAAAEHFGSDLMADPACKLNAMEGGVLKLLRDQEQELQQRRTEDTGFAREFYAIGADHARALIAAEQKGYDRGLADGRDGPKPTDVAVKPS